MAEGDEEGQDGLLSQLGVTAVPVSEVEGGLLSKACPTGCVSRRTWRTLHSACTALHLDMH